jgi:hypothetical protein
MFVVFAIVRFRVLIESQLNPVHNLQFSVSSITYLHRGLSPQANYTDLATAAVSSIILLYFFIYYFIILDVPGFPTNTVFQFAPMRATCPTQS